MGGMRGGPRLVCYPYITGALAILLMFVGFSYWSASSQNQELITRLEEMQSQLKVGSDTIFKLERENADHVKLLATIKKDLSKCNQLQQKDEKEKKAQEKKSKDDKQLWEKEKNSLQKKVSSLEEKLNSMSSGKMELVKQLEAEKERLEAQLLDEQEKAAGLETQLADLLKQNPRVNIKLDGKQTASVGRGQLPDVKPEAVRVIKKETLGKPGQLLSRDNNSNISSRKPVTGAASTKKSGEETKNKVLAAPGFNIEENSAEEAMMEINGAEVIEVPKVIKKEVNNSTAAKGWQRNPDRAEADSHLPEEENGLGGKHAIPNDDQDPGGEVSNVEDEEVEAAAVKKAAEAAVGLNLAEDVVEGAPDGEAVVNGEIVRAEEKTKKEEEDYELDRPVEGNGL